MAILDTSFVQAILNYLLSPPGLPNHGQGWQDREAGAGDEDHEDFQAGPAFCRPAESHIHAQPGTDLQCLSTDLQCLNGHQ